MSHTVVSLPRRQAIGSWRLFPGQAMSLRPRRDARLRVYCGRLWVTTGGPYRIEGRDAGDRFLSPGDVLCVPAGARLVMEPLAEPGDEQPVHFDWTEAAASPRRERFAREVQAPARELRQALAQTGLALARLLRGVAGWSSPLAASRG